MVLVLVGVPTYGGAPAFAQVSATVSVQSDDRFRGRSVSAGEPVALASISYDLESGVYLGGSVAGTTNGPGVGILRGSAHAGYVQGIGRNLSLDGGVVFNAYTNRYSGARSQEFAEFYAGINAGNFALYARYSPSYLDQNLQTLYLDANVVHDLGAGFRANARAGLLTRLAGDLTFRGATTRYDAQVGLTKDFDRFSVSVTLGTAGSGQGDYFSGPWQGRDSVVVGVNRSF